MECGVGRRETLSGKEVEKTRRGREEGGVIRCGGGGLRPLGGKNQKREE
jgi:hypothetical protein